MIAIYNPDCIEGDNANINGVPVNYHKFQTRRKRIAGCMCDSLKQDIFEHKKRKSNNKIKLYEGLKKLKRVKNTICSNFHLVNNPERSKMLEKLKKDVQKGKYHVNFDQLSEKLIGIIIESRDIIRG